MIIFAIMLLTVGFTAGVAASLIVQAGYDHDEQTISEFQHQRRAIERSRW